MATNFVQPGKVVTMTAPTGGVVAGEILAIGQLAGIALHDADEATEFEMAVEGVFTVAKTSALAISVGDALYLDAMNSVVNKTSAAQKEVGIAISAAANPSDTVDMLLLPTIRTSVAA